MSVNDLVLLITGITGSIAGLGALRIQWKKHKAEERVEESEARLGDVEQRVTEWAAINDRINADNERLRADNQGLRDDNERLRTELYIARFDIAALRAEAGEEGDT
ncbi:MAG: hypothetical protein LC798_07090 [Chloroflexi bacterium]|nr:hypothetical protein [Chloroflexota bacterium]